MKNRVKILLAILATILTAGISSRAENLVILHTNDTHSQILPDTKDNLGGVARRKVIIDSVRAAEKNVMLIDAGDVVQGSLYFNLYRGLVEEKIMNELGYDIRILGNHEFDNGIDTLAKYLSMAEADLIATNYDLSASPLDSLFKKYLIKETGGRKIGFIGINLDPKGMISDGNYDGVKYLDAIKSANSAAWWLKNIEKVDMVIAVTHIGYDPATPPGDKMLANSSEDIDIIIGGHSHTLLDPRKAEETKYIRVENSDGREVLITQVQKAGKYVGKIDIDLESLEPEYSLIEVNSSYDKRLDPEMLSMLKPYSEGVDSLNHVKVGRTAFEMGQDSPALHNLISDFVFNRGEELASGIDFSLVNRGGIRHGLQKGDIYEGEIITMMPFYNYVTVLEIKGSELLPAFKQMAKVGGQALGGNISVTFDAEDDEPEEIIINGESLDADKTYRVATIDYLAKGGDYMPTLANSKTLAKSTTLLYDDMLRYLRGPLKGKTLKPSKERRMKPTED